MLDFILFADDTTILYSHKDINSKLELINKELDEVTNWFKANKLSVNASKTNFMIMGTPHMTSTKTREDLNVLLDNALKWCQSYLTNIPEYVRIGNSSSTPVFHDYAVPQGSVLGPQWFTVYTYPVHKIILKYELRYHVYADDTQLYMSFKPTQECANQSIKNIESCICEIRRWMKDNFLKLNDNKTEFVLFGSRQQLSKVHVPHITIGDSNISLAASARNLGVIFDSSMSLKNHVSNVVRSASFHIRNIGRRRKYLDPHATEQIVHSFVTSRLDMGNSLLFGLPQDQINRLKRIQNAAARLVTLTKKRSHITPILRELHWLPVDSRITYKLLLIVFKALNDLAPDYISCLIKPYIPSRPLRSSTKLLLSEPPSTNSWGKRAFSVAAPRLWNSLPIKIRSSTSLAQFKKMLKTHLFDGAFA